MTEGAHNTEALALDALGALDDAQRRALDEHLAACAACRRERDELHAAAASLAHAVAPVRPPAELRPRILDAARALKHANGDARPPETSRGRVIAPPPGRFTRRAPRRTWVWAAVAAGVIASLLSFDIFRMWRENSAMRSEVARLRREAEQSREELARVRAESARERELAELISAPGARVLTLSATKDAPADASARLAYDDATGRAVLVAANLPPAPAGKAYQIWYVAGGRPVPGRLFQTDPAGRGTLRDEIPAAGRAAKLFAVTLEPEAGVAAPTGPVLLSAAT
ncbi:MAG TPA: anti-sigma factor [Pyrinomonadaceae bacterium]|nr:anti-sigma factor [Pyrinomonadaceae bacterium]